VVGTPRFANLRFGNRGVGAALTRWDAFGWPALAACARVGSASSLVVFSSFAPRSFFCSGRSFAMCASRFLTGKTGSWVRPPSRTRMEMSARRQSYLTEKLTWTKKTKELSASPFGLGTPPPCFCVCTGMIGLTGLPRVCTGIVEVSGEKQFKVRVGAAF